MKLPVPETGLKKHEKFWAFLALIASIVFLAWLARNIANESSSLRDAIIGLISLAGMAGQSLFRHSDTETKAIDTMHQAVDKIPPVTGEAAEQKPAEDPKLPPMFREGV